MSHYQRDWGGDSWKLQVSGDIKPELDQKHCCCSDKGPAATVLHQVAKKGKTQPGLQRVYREYPHKWHHCLVREYHWNREEGTKWKRKPYLHNHRCAVFLKLKQCWFFNVALQNARHCFTVALWCNILSCAILLNENLYFIVLFYVFFLRASLQCFTVCTLIIGTMPPVFCSWEWDRWSRKMIYADSRSIHELKGVQLTAHQASKVVKYDPLHALH